MLSFINTIRMKTVSSLLSEIGHKPKEVITISSVCDLMNLTEKHWWSLGGIKGFSKSLWAIAPDPHDVIWKKDKDVGGDFADVFEWPYQNVKIRFVIPSGKKSPILYVLKSLTSWYEGGESAKKDAIESLKVLADCPNRLPWHTQIGSERVYRGIVRPVTDVKKISLSDKMVTLTSAGGDLYIVGKVAYDPRYEVQSWSISKSIALGFSFVPLKLRSSGVPRNQWILSFKPSKNEIVFGNHFSQVSGQGMMITSEQEAIIAPKKGREITVMISALNLFYSIEQNINPLPPKGKRLILSEEDRVERLSKLLGGANAKTLMNMKYYRESLPRI